MTGISPGTIIASASTQVLSFTGTHFSAGLTVTISPSIGTLSGNAISNLTSTSFQVNATITTNGSYTAVVNSGGEASSPFAFNVQAAPTFTLTGSVREGVPTTFVVIQGATITIQDGPYAGRTTTTDSNGAYQIDGLTGSMNVTAAKSGYNSTTSSVNLSSNQTLNFNLNPPNVTVDETFTGSVDGGSAACQDTAFSTKPCKVTIIPVHNSGVIDATLTWSGGADLDLSLWRGTTLLASSRTASASTEHVSASASGGSNYELHVTYYDGSVIANYTLKVTHPK